MPMVIFVEDSEMALASSRMATHGMPIDLKQYPSAADALAEIQNGAVDPDLIITGHDMPLMNGLEFLQELRNHPQTRRTPVLMLAAEAKNEMKQLGRTLGLTGWIIKPFSHDQLNMAIARILRLPSQQHK